MLISEQKPLEGILGYLEGEQRVAKAVERAR